MSGLVIIIDGCNVDYIDKSITPFLYDLKERGGFSKLVASPCFANRAEIMTGNLPSTTDTFDDFCYDPENSPFKILKLLKTPISLRQRNPLFRKVISMLFALIFRYYVDIINIPLPFLPYFSLNKSTIALLKKEKERSEGHLFGILEKNGFKVTFIYGTTESIIRKMRKYSVNKNEILILHFGDTDHVGHKYGPNSLELQKTLKSISLYVKEIYNSIGLFDFIAVFGDHNMVEVKNNVNLWKELMKLDVKPIEDYFVFLSSTMACFWFKNEHARKTIEKFLSSLDYGRIATKKELKERGIPTDKKHGELIFWVRKGLNISPNFYLIEPIKGMHGYLDDQIETPLIVFHKSKKIKLEPKGRLVDIAPTLIDLLSIEHKYYHMDGKTLLIKNEDRECR